MEDTTDLEKLADICLGAAKRIKQYFATNGLAPLSFDQNGPLSFPTATEDIQKTRIQAIDASRKLYDLLLGSEYPVIWYPFQVLQDISAFRYVYHYNTAAAVPLNSTISYAELAAKTHVNESQLRQILRQLMSVHVFAEPILNQVSHTASSKCLLDSRIHASNAYVAYDNFKVIASVLPALEKYGHGNPHPTQSAFSYAWNTDRPMFTHFESHPGPRERFTSLMSYASSFPESSAQHAATGFDWASLPANSLVVDIGGNLGGQSIAIAEANPGIKCIVQDLSKVIQMAEDPQTSKVPDHLKDRIEFRPHDFWDPQPIKNADIYFLRWILHDYSDDYCSKILRNVIPAMKNGARIVLMERVIQKPGLAPYPLERLTRAADMQMMAITNAKERDEEEWHILMKNTNEKLKIRNINKPEGSVLSLIEIGLDD